MADVDEDVVQTPVTGQVEVDLSDETQDFRFLNHLNLYALELAWLRPCRLSMGLECRLCLC